MSLINDALKRASQVEKLRPIPRPAGPALQPAASHDDAPLLSRAVLLGLVGSLTLLLAAWFLWQWFAGVPAGKTSGTSLALTPARGAEKAAAAASALKGTAEKSLASAGDSAKSSLVNLAGSAKAAAATLTAAVARQAETPSPKSAAPTAEKSPASPRAAPSAPLATLANTASADHTPAAAAIVAPQIPPAIYAAIAKSAPEVEAAPRLLDPVAPAPPPFPVLRLQGVIYRSANASAFINGRVLCVGDKVDDAVLAKIDQQSVTFELAGQTKIVQLAR